MENETKQKIKEIADTYGFRNQSWQCVEECSELIKEICKWQRKWGSSLLSDSHECEERTNIIGEIADVKIMVEQLEYLLSAEYEVSEVVERKIQRQLERIKENA